MSLRLPRDLATLKQMRVPTSAKMIFELDSTADSKSVAHSFCPSQIFFGAKHAPG